MEADQTKKQEEPNDHEKWVNDSSLDYEGRIPLRASTGQWKASLFIVGMEYAEKMIHFSIAANLIIYLTKVMQQDLKTATKNSTCWLGVTEVMPLVGGFLADAYIGRFHTILASSIIYLLALLLLMMSQLVPSLKPYDSSICHEPRKIHTILFFISVYSIALGAGGIRSALESFGADQFDDDHPQERIKRMSFFNLWSVGLGSGMFTGMTLITYIQEQVNWAVAAIVLTIVMATALLVFSMGRKLYRFRKPSGSPLTPLLQVFVAAIAKRSLPYPSSHEELHESDKARGRLLAHTNKLKFLDKATIIEEIQSSNHKQNSWRLASVTQVEELKLIINMIPIWTTALPIGVVGALVNTLFIKQAASFDRKIAPIITIPPASMGALTPFGTVVSALIIDRVLEPLLRKTTKRVRGLTILQKIGIGMVFVIIVMVISALVERNRLAIVQQNSLGGSASMSVFWLVPQFLMTGIGSGFSIVGLQEYFYDQVPDHMRSLGIAFYVSIFGASSFICSLLITIVDRVSDKVGKSWFGKDLNHSRLDYFYWVIAVISLGNLCIYVLVARRYSYKSTRKTIGC